MSVEYHCCEPLFFVHIAIIVLLVTFAGMMSGLTLGLMSQSLVDLEVLANSGTPRDRRHAARILPVVKKQHLLLVTLLVCNSAAMEALPIFLDGLVSAWGAILISVTLILMFGEIIPQAICSRYGLAIGAAVTPVVRMLVMVCYPIAYPISKLLDFLLGEGRMALFRRAELKTLVRLHANEAGKGGELTHDETTIISGALELTEKKAIDAMTPLSETFLIDIDAMLDKNLMSLIIEKGHSRIPVFFDKPTNIIGLILVKNLLSVHAEDEVPVKSLTIRKIPRVPEDMPLYDILNAFEKGYSHLAVVIKQKKPTEGRGTSNSIACVKLDIVSETPTEKSIKHARSLQRLRSYRSGRNNSLSRRGTRSKMFRESSADVLKVNNGEMPRWNDEAIGIITLEDVIEELLQEEIFDETDRQV